MTRLKEDGNYFLNTNHNERRLYKHQSDNNVIDLRADDFIIPVVVHIFHQNGIENISDAQINRGIQDLNDAFANVNSYQPRDGLDSEISFCLARRDPDNNYTNGITRTISVLTNMVQEDDELNLKNLSRWEPHQYLNIWVVNSVSSKSAGTSVVGYAYFPSSHGDDLDGIVIESEFVGSSPEYTAILVHEVGHYLGLYHTFHGGCKNDDCLLDGDRVCDTPPDGSSAIVPCAAIVNTCTTDTPDREDMYWNYMDYGDNNCYSAFTPGQVERMHFALSQTRKSLLESRACLDPCTGAVTAEILTASDTIPSGTNLSLSATSTNTSMYLWTIDGDTISSDLIISHLFKGEGIIEVIFIGQSTDPSCPDVADTIYITLECDINTSFVSDQINPVVGDTIRSKSNSDPTLTHKWTANGMEISDSLTSQYPFDSKGLVVICLTVSNAFCSSRICKNFFPITIDTTCTNCPEICDNGIDDDGDGYVDCFDQDCYCIEDTCVIDDFKGVISMRRSWKSNTNYSISYSAQPLVANLNPTEDDMPEIIVAARNAFLAFKGDGSNRNNPDTLYKNTRGKPDLIVKFTPVIGDINRDGVPELINLTDYKFNTYVTVYTDFNKNNNPAMRYWFRGFVRDFFGHLSLADFDGDGLTEIYNKEGIAQFDFSVNPPKVIKKLSVNRKIKGFKLNSVAVDVLDRSDCNGDPDCDGLEFVTSLGIYSIDLDPNDGDGYEIKMQRDLLTMQPNLFEGGSMSIADVNLDGVLDIVVAGSRIINGINTKGVYIWNKNSFLTWFEIPLVNASSSLPVISNIFDDLTQNSSIDLPEIIVNSTDKKNGTMFCFNLNAQKMGKKYGAWWWIYNGDDSGSSLLTTFDFDNDEFKEIVYRNESQIRVMYGGASQLPTGVDVNRNWTSYVCKSWTAHLNPIVVDVDNDGEAEIITIGGISSGLTERFLQVFESDLTKGDPWMPARAVWNQHPYFSVNINDDLTIPRHQQLHHLEFPVPGTGYRPFNNFLVQSSIYDNDFRPYRPLPDLVVDVLQSECEGDSIVLSIEVCNQGNLRVIKDDVFLSLYEEDPRVIKVNQLKQLQLKDKLKKGECDTLSLTIQKILNQDIFIVVSDNGSVTTPFDLNVDYPATEIIECNYSNNITKFNVVYTTPVEVNIGPDTTICRGGVLTLDVGDNWTHNRWQDGSTERTITIWNEGRYTVRVWDDCGSESTDTINIVFYQPIQPNLGRDTSLCIGDSLSLSIVGFEQVNWIPKSIVNCSDCDQVMIYPDRDTNVIVTALDSFGCLLLDTLHITINSLQENLDTIYICKDDSVLIDRKYINKPGNYPWRKISSTDCDTLFVTTVNVLSTSSFRDSSYICDGDSVLIGGQWINSEGVFYDTMKYVLSNCDSLFLTHEVFVSMSSQIMLDTAICDGDSIWFNNSWLRDDGMFVQTIKSIHGCDSSIINLLVEVYEDPPVEVVDTTLCYGESLILQDTILNTQGQYVKSWSYPSSACDSLIQIWNIQYNAKPITIEIDTIICEGDSLFYEGEWLDEEASYQYSKSFLDGGCDSITTILNLSIESLPTINGTFDYQVNQGDTIVPDIVISSNTQIKWQPKEGLGCADCANPQIVVNEDIVYQVTIVNEHGCITIVEITITVKDKVIISDSTDFYIPTIISPKSQFKQNKYFYVQASESYWTSYDLQIYDRWGNLIFNRLNLAINVPESGWNGRFSTRRLNPGVFVYKINLRSTREEIIDVGTITLVE